MHCQKFCLQWCSQLIGDNLNADCFNRVFDCLLSTIDPFNLVTGQNKHLGRQDIEIGWTYSCPGLLLAMSLSKKLTKWCVIYYIWSLNTGNCFLTLHKAGQVEALVII